MAVLCCMNLFAQYSTSKAYMAFPVRTFPDYYVPEDMQTYNATLQVSRQIGEHISKDDISNRIQFDEWVNVDNPDNAFLKIFLESYDFIIEGMHEIEVREMVREYGVMHEHVFFVPQIDYSMVINWDFEIGTQREHHTNINPNTRRPDISSFQMDRKFHSPRECHEYMRDNRDVFLEKIMMTELLAVTDQIQERITKCFRYGRGEDQIKICLFDNKKSEYYDKHHNGKQELKNIFAQMPLEGPLTNTIKKMQPWIEHFKEVEKSLSSSDKKQKAAKADMVYSLAQIYLGLEIFDVSREYATRLQNEFGDNAGKRIIREIDQIEQLLKKHHMQSRHF